jgi:exodeoxyribonuclease VIII
MIIYDQPLPEYLRQRRVTKHLLDAVDESPLHAWEAIHLPPPPPTEAMIRGSVVDTLLCEPEKLTERFHIRPPTYGPEAKKWNSNANECKEWIASHIDKPIVPADMLMDAEAMVAAVNAEPKARHLLEKAQSQVTVTWESNRSTMGLAGRPDFVGERFAADLKTCRSANPRSLSHAILQYRYHVQAALYVDGLRANGMDCNDFYFIFVDNSTRPKVNVRLLTQKALDLGRFTYTQQLAILNECIENDRWPGYSGTEDEPVKMIDVPEWAYGAGALNLVIGGEICTLD